MFFVGRVFLTCFVVICTLDIESSHMFLLALQVGACLVSQNGIILGKDARGTQFFVEQFFFPASPTNHIHVNSFCGKVKALDTYTSNLQVYQRTCVHQILKN